MAKIEDKLIEEWSTLSTMFEEEPSSTKVSIPLPGEEDNPQRNMTTAAIHNALMAAGMAPGIGNIADGIDALLYGIEGQFGEAALSASAMVPIAGQWINTQRAIKKAKDSGEEIVKVYRGVDQWYAGRMVRDGKFVSGAKRIGPTFRPKENLKVKDLLYTSLDFDNAKSYSMSKLSGKGRKQVWGHTPKSRVLEFHIPKSVFDAEALDAMGGISKKAFDDYQVAVFKNGIPTQYLAKVHKGLDK